MYSSASSKQKQLKARKLEQWSGLCDARRPEAAEREPGEWPPLAPVWPQGALSLSLSLRPPWSRRSIPPPASWIQRQTGPMRRTWASNGAPKCTWPNQRSAQLLLLLPPTLLASSNMQKQDRQLIESLNTFAPPIRNPRSQATGS